MLAADKVCFRHLIVVCSPRYSDSIAPQLLLQSNVKQRSIELREKELNLFNSNFSAVGTQVSYHTIQRCTVDPAEPTCHSMQAAIMAGFTLTSFVEIDLPPNKRWAKVPHAIPTSCQCRPVSVKYWRTLVGDAPFLRYQLNLRQFRLRCHGDFRHRLG